MRASFAKMPDGEFGVRIKYRSGEGRFNRGDEIAVRCKDGTSKTVIITSIHTQGGGIALCYVSEAVKHE